tara:strand:- start:54 stop:410 length:357 start_codon:yes stop_codon:yes gene_type:complete
MTTATLSPDLALPANASPAAARARDAIVDRLVRDGNADTGGCHTFYTPEEWAARGEEYGLDSVLIVVHDGGGAAPYFNLDYEAYNKFDRMGTALGRAGFWPEACTCWYTAIYADGGAA